MVLLFQALKFNKSIFKYFGVENLKFFQNDLKNLNNFLLMRSPKILSFLPILILILLTYFILSQSVNLKKLESLEKEKIELAKNFYKNENGDIYLYSTDPWYFYAHAENILNGERGENFSYLIVAFYKILNLFKKTSLLKAAFWLPVILGILSVIVFYFIAKKIFLGSKIAFMASLFFIFSQRFFVFNHAGYTDTQTAAMLLSLSAILAFINFDFSKIFQLKNLFSLVALFSLFYIFKKIWRGWFFVLAIIALFVLVYCFIYLIKSAKETNFFRALKEKRKILSVVGAAISIFLILIFGLNFLSKNFNYIYGHTQIGAKSLLEKSFWPSIGANVAELQQYSLKEFLFEFGGWWFFLIALVSIFILISELKKQINFNYILILVWLAPLLIMSFLSLRFTFYVLPPWSLLLALTPKKILEKTPKKFNFLSFFLISILIIALSYPGLNLAFKSFLPKVNDAIYAAATWLKENTGDTALILNYWDTGYFWEALARREVLRNPGGKGNYFDDYYFSLALASEDANLTKKIFEAYKCGTIEKIAEQKIIDKEQIKNFNFDCEKEREIYLILTQEDVYKIKNLFQIANWFEKKDFNIKISDIGSCLEKNQILECGNAIINIKEKKIGFKNKIPKNLIVFKEGEKVAQSFETKEKFSTIVFNDGKNWGYFFVENAENAMLIRLFAGEAIEDFDLVYSAGAPYRVVIYKV